MAIYDYISEAADETSNYQKRHCNICNRTTMHECYPFSSKKSKCLECENDKSFSNNSNEEASTYEDTNFYNEGRTMFEWFEYDDDEFFLKTIILFPFRLIYRIVAFILSAIFSTLGFVSKFVIKLNIAIPLSVLAYIFIILIIIPIRIFVYIISFGNRIIMEDGLFKWSSSLHYWVIKDFKEDPKNYIYSYDYIEVFLLYFFYGLQWFIALSLFESL